VDRYKIVAVTLQVLRDYQYWKIDEILWESGIQAIKDEAEAEAKAAEARAAKACSEASKAREFDISVNAFHHNNPKSWDEIIERLKSCDIPESTIRKAEKQVKAELDKKKA
jgi:secreted Zn-dependent insulinase-like peptidase